MSSRSILLIEVLDAPGADAADASLRLRALRAAGWNARAVTLGPAAGAAGAEGPADAEAWAGLARRVPEESVREIWVAGSRAGYGAVQRLVGDARPVRWWPTVVPTLADGSGPEPPLVTDGPDHTSRGADHASRGARDSAALDLGIVRPERPRARAALWDGEFVLVPGPLTGSAGRELLAAFADAASTRPELDLVVLADPQPARIREARALGVYARVHFAGVAPREAEHVWCATAAAVLLPFVRPVAAGLLLRVLAAGRPLVPFGEAALTRWLSTCLAARIGLEPQPARQALDQALAPPAALLRALERGRALAASHEPEALARRLIAPGDARSRDVA